MTEKKLTYLQTLLKEKLEERGKTYEQFENLMHQIRNKMNICADKSADLENNSGMKYVSDFTVDTEIILNAILTKRTEKALWVLHENNTNMTDYTEDNFVSIEGIHHYNKMYEVQMWFIIDFNTLTIVETTPDEVKKFILHKLEEQEKLSKEPVKSIGQVMMVDGYIEPSEDSAMVEKILKESEVNYSLKGGK